MFYNSAILVFSAISAVGAIINSLPVLAQLFKGEAMNPPAIPIPKWKGWLGITLGFLALAGVCFVIYENLSLPVPKAFLSASQQYHKDLGDLVTVTPGVSNYMALHKKAIILWLGSPYFYVLSLGDNTWERMDFPNKQLPSDMRWRNENYIKEQTPFNGKNWPKDCVVPWGEVAELWHNNPDEWEHMVGCREWQCGTKGLSALIYPRGMIVGPYRNHPTQYDDVGRQFVLVYNSEPMDQTKGRWYEVDNVTPDRCSDPEQEGP